MSPTELMRVRDANKLVARRQRARQSTERDELRLRMRQLNDEHVKLLVVRDQCRKRISELVFSLQQTRRPTPATSVTPGN